VGYRRRYRGADAHFAQDGTGASHRRAALRVALHPPVSPWSARRDRRRRLALARRLRFMHRALMDEQLKSWSSARLSALIEPLRAAQTRARANAGVAQMEAERALWNVARAARR
jgi:DNA polymerase-3 subunit delta